MVKKNTAPWSVEFVQKFCELVSLAQIDAVIRGPLYTIAHNAELPPGAEALPWPAGLTLAGVGNPRPLSVRFAEYCAVVMRHPVLQTLRRDVRFMKAERSFREWAASSDCGEQRETLQTFRFAGVVAGIMGMHADHPSHKPNRPNRRELQQALGHVERLRKSLLEGVRLSDWSKQATLQQSLEDLRIELKLDLSKSAPPIGRDDAGAVNRFWVDEVLDLLLDEFGFAAVSIALPILDMLEIEMDASNVQRRIDSVNERREHDSIRRAALQIQREPHDPP
jgi:hypothetical protein